MSVMLLRSFDCCVEPKSAKWSVRVGLSVGALLGAHAGHLLDHARQATRLISKVSKVP